MEIQCTICQSINHCAPKCPDKALSTLPQNTYFKSAAKYWTLAHKDSQHDYEVVMYHSDFDHPHELKGPLAESFDTTTYHQMKDARCYFIINKFGDGKKNQPTNFAIIPFTNENKKVRIHTVIVDQDIHNSSEFINQKLLKLVYSCGIKIVNTGAKSQWSGWVSQSNYEMMQEILNDEKCNIVIAFWHCSFANNQQPLLEKERKQLQTALDK